MYVPNITRSLSAHWTSTIMSIHRPRTNYLRGYSDNIIRYDNSYPRVDMCSNCCKGSIIRVVHAWNYTRWCLFECITYNYNVNSVRNINLTKTKQDRLSNQQPTYAAYARISFKSYKVGNLSIGKGSLEINTP